MKKILALAFSLIFVLSCALEQIEKNPNYSFGTIHWEGEWITRDTAKWEYPCTVDSAILMLFHNWQDSTTLDFKSIPDSTLAGLNHGAGMWLRNSYGLWNRTCLVEHFWEMGIMHPDDMSAILLTSYHRFLNAQELEIPEQVEMYKLFWLNEMDIEYKLEDSLSWDFTFSM